MDPHCGDGCLDIPGNARAEIVFGKHKFKGCIREVFGGKVFLVNDPFKVDGLKPFAVGMRPGKKMAASDSRAGSCRAFS